MVHRRLLVVQCVQVSLFCLPRPLQHWLLLPPVAAGLPERGVRHSMLTSTDSLTDVAAFVLIAGR